MSEQNAVEPLTKSVNGNDVFRADLRTIPFLGGYAVQDPESCTILVVGGGDHYGMVFESYIFKDQDSARRWIAEGCISEIQEGTSCLAVVFTNKLMTPPLWKTSSSDPRHKNKIYG